MQREGIFNLKTQTLLRTINALDTDLKLTTKPVDTKRGTSLLYFQENPKVQALNTD